MKIWQVLILTFLTAALVGMSMGFFNTGWLADLAAALIITVMAWRWIEILKR